MANRNTAPDAAFACIMDVGGVKYKLLRHHKLDIVRDGNEHDTVDTTMLSFSLRMIDQVPVSTEDKDKIRQHLREHEAALARSIVVDEQPDNLRVKDVNRNKLDEENARKLVSEQAGGPDGNDSLQNPTIDMTLSPDNSAVVRTEDGTTTAQLAQPNAGGSITGGGSTPTQTGEKGTDGGNPKGDVQETQDVAANDDVEKKPSAGLGKPAHKDIVSVGPAQTGRPGVETDGGIKNVTNPGDVERGAGLPTSSALHKPEEDIKGKKAKSKGDDDPKAKPEKEKDVEPKGKKKSKVDALHPDVLKSNPTGLLKKRDNLENINIADKNKNQPGIKVQAKAEIGDWVRNDEGLVGQVVSIKDGNKPIIKVPRTGAEVSNEGWKVIVKANEVNKDDPVDVLAKELRILNSPEALMKFATPTPEGQAARKNKIALCSVQDLTEVGLKFVKERLFKVIAGKVNAKILSVDKLGSRELVVVRMGDDDEFPISTMLEIRKNKDGKVDAISMFDSFLPVEAFRDFAKFLNNLAKQGSVKANLSNSGAKLESCVSSVLDKKVSDFKKKAVKHLPLTNVKK